MYSEGCGAGTGAFTLRPAPITQDSGSRAKCTDRERMRTARNVSTKSNLNKSKHSKLRFSFMIVLDKYWKVCEPYSRVSRAKKEWQNNDFSESFNSISSKISGRDSNVAMDINIAVAI